MEQVVQTKTFKFIFAAMVCLFLGLTSSPSLVAGYHILIFIPILFLINNEGYRCKLSKSSWALIGLTLWGLIVTAINHGYYGTLQNVHKSYDELKYYAFAVYSIIGVAYFFKHATTKQIKILLNLLLAAVVIGFFVGIARSKFGFCPLKLKMCTPGKYHEWRSGGFTNYMRYGYSSGLMFVLGIGACFNYSKVSKFVNKYWLATFLLFNALGVVFSETRGAILVILCGVSFVLIKYRPVVGKSLVGLGAAGVMAVAIITATGVVKHRYLNINDNSNNKRMSQFYAAVKSIEERPIIGLGADQFSYNVYALKQRHKIWQEDYTGHSHNIFLEHAANYGIPGLICFALFLIFWFWELIKSKTDKNWVIVSYLVGFIIGGQVELLFDVINSHLIFFLYAYSKVDLAEVG